ncbi:MAG: hypothetical protein K6E79_07665 [Pseudobutyrivibrio sp.]|nr:hypothetical protein [Pseudobutyrivibrio sp.]
MKMKISNSIEKYEITFDKITQLCGTNISTKSHIINSISKHFSSEKYKEYEEAYIDNIRLDNEIPGRKQFECNRVNCINDVINGIQYSKTSILGKCVKEVIGQFDCQNELAKIDEILLSIFQRVNNSFFADEMVELQYTQEDLFGMIQHASIRTNEDKDVHTLDNYELIKLYIDLIGKEQELLPEKRLYIFENIDHLLARGEYINVVQYCESLAEKTNVWFIFATSLDGYIYISENNIEGINVINDIIFTMPDLEHLKSFIRENYPIEKEWNNDLIKEHFVDIVQKIGRKDFMLDFSELVILKLINDSNLIRETWNSMPKMPEIQCLLDSDMI